MEIKTKYAIGEEVYFMPGQLHKVVKQPVIKIDVHVERKGLDDDKVEQSEKYSMQGGYGPMNSSELFPTRQDLLNSL